MGEQNVAASLASVERRFIRHQARINHVLGMGAGGARMRGGAEGGPSGVIRAARASTQVQQRAVRLTREQLSAVKSLSSEHKVAQRYEITKHREKLKNVEREKRAEINKIKSVRLAEVRQREAHSRSFRGAALGGARNAVGGLASVGKTGAAMLGVGGSVLAASAVTDALKLDEQVRRFAVAGRAPGSAGVDPEAVRKSVTNIATARGIAPEAVMAGAQQFQTVTGDGEMGLKMADRFATFAQATGGDPADIADAAAALFQNLNIKDIDALTEALAKLTFQGKAGSFEFKDMAAQLPRITGALSGRGIGGGTGGVAKMGAAMQVIQRDTRDAARTSTAFDAVLRQMVAKAGDIQSGKAFSTGKKVDVFEGGDATGAFRGDFDKLIADVLKASGGNSIELQKMFGDEGMTGLNPFVAKFKGAGGGDAGHAAVLKMFSEFEQVGGNYAEVQRDAADVQKSTTIQFEVAMMELKQVFADELVPVARELVPQLRELAPALRAVTQYALAVGKALADNPMMGLGAILAGSIALEIGKAQIASVIQGGALSPLGAFGLAVTAATGAVIAYDAWLEKNKQEGIQKARDASKRGDVVRNEAKAELDKNGILSPETRKKLQDLDATEGKTLDASQAYDDESFFKYGLFGRSEEERKKKDAIKGATASPEYIAGVGETRTLLGTDKLAQQYGPENFKAAEVGAAIGDAVVAKINAATINRTDKPGGPGPVGK